MAVNTVNNEESASSFRATLNTWATQINTNITDIDDKQPKDSDLTAIAALTPSNDDSIFRVAGAWLNRNPTQAKAILAIAEADVSGLTSSLAGKQAASSADTTIWRVNLAGDNDYSIVAGDNKKVVVITNTVGKVVNIPLNSSQALAVGTEIRVVNAPTSVGNVTITPAGGVTTVLANGATLVMAAQTAAHLIKIDTDSWLVSY